MKATWKEKNSNVFRLRRLQTTECLQPRPELGVKLYKYEGCAERQKTTETAIDEHECLWLDLGHGRVRFCTQTERKADPGGIMSAQPSLIATSQSG